MWNFDDYDVFGEPTDEELLGIETHPEEGDGLEVICPNCGHKFSLLKVRYIASDPQCPECKHVYGGEY